MEAPARLPANEAELAEWSVYVDWLLERGEPHAELLAMELALPAAPPREQLRAWHALVRRVYREPPAAPIGWCLGHARTLVFANAQVSHFRPNTSPEGAITNVYGILEAEAASRSSRPSRFSRLERLHLTIDPYDTWRSWRRLFAALPASCRRVLLDLTSWPDAQLADELVAALPATVRELEVTAYWERHRTEPPIAAFVNDRFDLVGLRETSIDGPLGGRIADALARSRSVQLRVSRFGPAVPLPWDRCVLGLPSDAALLEPAHRRGTVLGRTSLVTLQRRFGPIPVRTQLAAILPEGYSIGLQSDGRVSASPLGDDLVRRGDAWTLRGLDSPSVRLNGELVAPGEIVPVHDGDQLRIGGADCVLVTRDPTSVVRAWG